MQAPTGGQPCTQHDGAKNSKERTYPELLATSRCKLFVLAIEVGCRWSQEAANFSRLLAKSKARQALAILQPALQTALVSRWSAILSHATSQAFAATLLTEELPPQRNVDNNLPSISQILAESPLTPPHLQRPTPKAVDFGQYINSQLQHIWRGASIKTVQTVQRHRDPREKKVWEQN